MPVALGFQSHRYTTPMHSLDRFVQLPENRSAYQAVVRLASSNDVSFLYLHGPPGSGKSHLVRGLVEQMTRVDPAKTAQVLAAAELGRAMMQPPLERRAISREAIGVDLLVIDDIHHLLTGAGNEVAHIIDRRLARRRPTVVTAGRGPAELDASPRLASRLVGGLIVGIQPLGEASRRELAASLCRERQLSVTDEVIAWLARDPGGARPILGGIAHLEVLGRAHPTPLTMAQVSAELPGVPTGDQSPMDNLVARVASRFGVDAKAIRGPSRERRFAWPRQVAMFVARQAGYSFPQIGAYFGGRDHTTVMHSCEKVAKQAEEDMQLAQELRDLLAQIQ
jgi:chromosomal replication initiator protein